MHQFDPDERKKETTADFAKKEFQESNSIPRKLWSYLLPDKLFVLKYFLPYLIIIFLILPAYYGLKKFTNNKIRPVQEITLFPGRTMDEPFFNISKGNHALISFVFEGAIPNEAYQIIIESEDGKIIFHDDEFMWFDAYGRGRLVLLFDEIKHGGYKLTITDPRAESPLNQRHYTFRIEK